MIPFACVMTARHGWKGEAISLVLTAYEIESESGLSYSGRPFSAEPHQTSSGTINGERYPRSPSRNRRLASSSFFTI
jgi:hypothetical protein